MKLEDIIRFEIWHHFRKLILVYIIGGTIFLILNALFILTAVVLVPWRLKLNYIKIRVIYQKMRLNYKGNSIPLYILI